MDDLLDFFFEAGKLKDEIRTGWKFLSVENPESVAEHSFRAALIGYFIGVEEGVDADKVMKILLFHDLPEARIGDIHKVAVRYLNKEEAEEEVIEHQAERFPEKIAEEYKKLMHDFKELETQEAIVARDADLLECAIQAKEYMEKGHEKAERWIENAEKEIRTETGKKIMEIVKNKETVWWDGLKDFKRD